MKPMATKLNHHQRHIFVTDDVQPISNEVEGSRLRLPVLISLLMWALLIAGVAS